MARVGVRIPSDPTFRRWMMFVDGEYLTLEGQKLLKDAAIDSKKGPHWIPDVFLWIPGFDPLNGIEPVPNDRTLWLQHRGLRCTYYTSATGSDHELKCWRHTIHEACFSPVIIKKPRGQRQTKGVDVSLATDMLTHAFLNNYEAALLCTGDADFIPVVEQVRRQGKQVFLMHLGKSYGTSEDLMLATDTNGDLSELLTKSWAAVSAAQDAAGR